MTFNHRPLNLGPLQSFGDDSSVSEILVDGHNKVYLERKGKFEDRPTPFQSEAHLRETIEAISTPLGHKLDPSQPMMDVRLTDPSA